MRLGFAAESDVVAEAAELADEPADAAVVVALALVVVRAEVFIPGAGAGQQGVAGLHLASYPGTVRQLAVTGLGRDAPTVIITNDDTTSTRAIIGQYARRMTIEQRLAEIIRAF